MFFSKITLNNYEFISITDIANRGHKTRIVPVEEKYQALIIDDDVAFSESVAEYLENENFICEIITEPEDAIVRVGEKPFDIIILDIMLPRVNGYRVFKYIREQVDTPILMLTGRTSDLEEVIGLELGSDDYVKKPCNMKVLTTRLIKVIEKNRQIECHNKKTELKVGCLTLDLKKRQVYISDKQIKITNTEFKILEFLASHKGQSCNKAAIVEFSLGREPYTKESSLDVHISHLRKKFNKEHCDFVITTNYGYGFTLDESN